MVCLSGEPGNYSETEGFSRNEHENMKVLTGYLGTGYSFGIQRLKDTFLDAPKRKRPTHILVITDSDIFAMLKATQKGWDIVSTAAERAGGGATCVLELPYPTAGHERNLERLRDCGLNTFIVANMSQLTAFARNFSRLKYVDKECR